MMGDMIGFGRPFVANPDLTYRSVNNVRLNEHNSGIFLVMTRQALRIFRLPDSLRLLAKMLRRHSAKGGWAPYGAVVIYRYYLRLNADV